MKMSEREKAAVGLHNAPKPTALEVKAYDMTRHLVTCDSAPPAAIAADVPWNSAVRLSNISKRLSAERRVTIVVYNGKRALEAEQS